MARTIQVRDVPDEVHAELRRRAADAGTSLSDYVADELRRVASRSANAEVLLRAAQRSWSVDHDELIEALDEGRAGR
jgi:plasmid stability protein